MSDEATAGGGGYAIRAGSVRNGSLGRFVSVAGADTLTEQQKAFVESFCTNGGDAKRACKDAGYLSPHAPSRLLGLTQVRHAVSLNLERQIRGEGASLAWGCVLHLLRDPSTPSAVRFQASKFVLESAGLTQATPKAESVPLASMTLQDLEALVDATRQSLASVVEVEGAIENENVEGATPPVIPRPTCDSIDAP